MRTRRAPRNGARVRQLALGQRAVAQQLIEQIAAESVVGLHPRGLPFEPGRPSLVLLVYFSFYILLGLGEELLFGRRRRAAARAAAEAAEAAALPAEEEPLLPAEEDEVPLDNPAAATANGAGDDEPDA